MNKGNVWVGENTHVEIVEEKLKVKHAGRRNCNTITNKSDKLSIMSFANLFFLFFLLFVFFLLLLRFALWLALL